MNRTSVGNTAKLRISLMYIEIINIRMESPVLIARRILSPIGGSNITVSKIIITAINKGIISSYLLINFFLSIIDSRRLN